MRRKTVRNGIRAAATLIRYFSASQYQHEAELPESATQRHIGQITGRANAHLQVPGMTPLQSYLDNSGIRGILAESPCVIQSQLKRGRARG